MQIAILLYEGITTLDAVGPYEVLHRLPGADVRFVATEPGPQRDDNGALALVAEHSPSGRLQTPTCCSSPVARAAARR